jgi:hypothetical protein
MSRFLPGLLFIIAVGMATGQETTTLNATVSVGKLGFSRDRTADDETYSGTLLPHGNVSFAYPVSDSTAMYADLNVDPVLKDSLSGRFGYNGEWLRGAIGPIVGISVVDLESFVAGLVASGRMEIGGKAYLDAAGSYGLGFSGVRRSEIDVSLGWYASDSITSINGTLQSFTSVSGTTDARERYEICLDIFQKYVPYRLALGLAYQRVLKEFSADPSPVRHRLNSIILGTDLIVPVRGMMNVSVGLQSSIFTFGVADETFLTIPSTGFESYLFDVRLGVEMYFW